MLLLQCYILKVRVKSKLVRITMAPSPTKFEFSSTHIYKTFKLPVAYQLISNIHQKITIINDILPKFI